MKKSFKTSLRNAQESKSVFYFLTFFVLVFASHFVSAQSRFSAILRPGVNFPTKDLGNADLKTGFGVEGTIAYRIMPHLAAYTGWGWNHFAADQSFAGTDMDFDETGYRLGLQFIHPITKSELSYVLGAGAIYNHIEVENNKGDIISDSGHGWGWQADAGLSVPLGNRLHLLTGIRYQSLSRNIKIGAANTTVDLNYLSAGVGIKWIF